MLSKLVELTRNDPLVCFMTTAKQHLLLVCVQESVIHHLGNLLETFPDCHLAFSENSTSFGFLLV